MPIKAVTFDAYGTLVRNEDLRLIPRRIVEDHGLAVPPDDLLRAWVDLYFEATQARPFRTLREIEQAILTRVLRQFGVAAAADPYVDLFFQVTTKVDLYPDVRPALDALGHLRAAIVSNADHEHVAAWSFSLPVQFILVSEGVGCYKPDPSIFARALDRLGLAPSDVLHVGDSDVDDVGGARRAGLQVAWLNRDGRALRPGVPQPDFEIRDLGELAALVRSSAGPRRRS